MSQVVIGALVKGEGWVEEGEVWVMVGCCFVGRVVSEWRPEGGRRAGKSHI